MHALNTLHARIARRGKGSDVCHGLAVNPAQKIRVTDSPDSARRQRPMLCARPWLQTQTVFQQVGATRWAVPVYVRTVRTR